MNRRSGSTNSSGSRRRTSRPPVRRVQHLCRSEIPSACSACTYLLPSVADPVQSRVRRSCLTPGCPHALPDQSLDVPACRLLRVSDRRPRESRAPPPTRRASVLWPPTPAHSTGSDPLDLALPPVGKLALEPRHRPARDVLAWHRQGFRLYWRWTFRPQTVGRPRLDPELRDLSRRHGAGESDVGAAADPGGTRPARLQSRRTDHHQAHAPDLASAVLRQNPVRWPSD
jgi:hypothetical protein